MSLIKYQWPALSDFYDDDWMKTRFANRDWFPAINVVDNEGNYEIEMVAPGMKKEDFSVAIENGVLIITGKTENEKEEKEKNYTRKEFTSRSFTKSFTLPDNVEADAVKAKYDDGVLRLVLDKTTKELPSKKEVVIH